MGRVIIVIFRPQTDKFSYQIWGGGAYRLDKVLWLLGHFSFEITWLPRKSATMGRYLPKTDWQRQVSWFLKQVIRALRLMAIFNKNM